MGLILLLLLIPTSYIMGSDKKVKLYKSKILGRQEWHIVR